MENYNETIQWCKADLRMDACKQIAQECRESGKYDLVEIRKRRPEAGVKFGKVFVRRKMEVVLDPHPINVARAGTPETGELPDGKAGIQFPAIINGIGVIALFTTAEKAWKFRNEAFPSYIPATTTA